MIFSQGVINMKLKFGVHLMKFGLKHRIHLITISIILRIRLMKFGLRLAIYFMKIGLSLGIHSMQYSALYVVWMGRGNHLIKNDLKLNRHYFSLHFTLA